MTQHHPRCGRLGGPEARWTGSLAGFDHAELQAAVEGAAAAWSAAGTCALALQAVEDAARATAACPCRGC